MTKTEQIVTTLKETRELRKGQRPVVYELKLQNLSKRKAEALGRALR